MKALLVGTYASLTFGIVAVLVACAATGFIGDMERFDPPDGLHDRIYNEVQACLEENGYPTHGEPDHVEWYLADDLPNNWAAVWLRPRHTIVFQGNHYLNPRIISHEVVHETMPLVGHDSSVWEDCEIHCGNAQCPVQIMGKLYGPDI